jgi:hypothetical protein
MILVDAHVHIHDCFDLGMFLDSAFENFRIEADRIKLDDASSFFVLLLTETARDNWFERLADHADEKWVFETVKSNGWSFHRTDETCSLLAESTNGQRMILIAGRQIATKEDLEVLALLTDSKFEDGLPLSETIRIVRENGAIPTVPWGFGKWTGKRGNILKSTFQEANQSILFLGDNGGRPIFWPRPHLFKMAVSHGMRILPGSDPLPFASESNRPGSFGFWVEGTINFKEPAKYIRRIILDSKSHITPYGTLERPFRFLRNQSAMQILKRKRKRNLGY